jgi:hypothetical protein
VTDLKRGSRNEQKSSKSERDAGCHPSADDLRYDRETQTKLDVSIHAVSVLALLRLLDWELWVLRARDLEAVFDFASLRALDLDALLLGAAFAFAFPFAFGAGFPFEEEPL